MERLMSIDNGGTFTDIAIGSGTDRTFTQTSRPRSISRSVCSTA